ncbi:putative holin-like toxin [Sporolactobacillus terrae]|nr:putative holin-like toxin [Sporolactobacillus terrae]UAK16176.1 putative holin-like toxin [Sporolactobacillus terrae]
MTTYQAISLMISFSILIIMILSFKDKTKK